MRDDLRVKRGDDSTNRSSLSETELQAATVGGTITTTPLKAIGFSVETLIVEEGAGISLPGTARQQTGRENWGPQSPGLQHAGFVMAPEPAFAVGVQKPASVTRTVAKAASLRNIRIGGDSVVPQTPFLFAITGKAG